MSLMLPGARLDMMTAKRKQAGGIMDSREKFEKWFEDECEFITQSASNDTSAWIKHGFWTAWQASRAAMKQDLPLQHEAKEG